MLFAIMPFPKYVIKPTNMCYKLIYNIYILQLIFNIDNTRIMQNEELGGQFCHFCNFFFYFVTKVEGYTIANTLRCFCF